LFGIDARESRTNHRSIAFFVSVLNVEKVVNPVTLIFRLDCFSVLHFSVQARGVRGGRCMWEERRRPLWVHTLARAVRYVVVRASLHRVTILRPPIMLSAFVALFSISSVGLLYRSTSDSATSLSPQGCRMSYMDPSYFIQSQFDTSWTPLAKRYSLLLYREVGWEDDEVCFVLVLASS